jgi:hypothetical protein
MGDFFTFCQFELPQAYFCLIYYQCFFPGCQLRDLRHYGFITSLMRYAGKQCPIPRWKLKVWDKLPHK